MNLPTYIEDVPSWSQEFKLFYEVSVRFSETDAFGHLNNTNAFVYFEHARIQFFKEIGLMDLWLDQSEENIPVTADLHCDYFKQVYFNEQLRLGVKVAEIGRTSMELHYLILNEKGDICMTGRGRIVQVSKNSGKPAIIEDSFKELLRGKK